MNTDPAVPLTGVQLKAQDESLEYNRWQCLECEGQPSYTKAEMMKHLPQAHGIDPRTTKGAREMTMHADGRDFYLTSFTWTFGGKRFINSICNRRKKNR